ncbi:MAG: hypothetical protein ABW022_12365 [Actinoplanes sp.]
MNLNAIWRRRTTAASRSERRSNTGRRYRRRPDRVVIREPEAQWLAAQMPATTVAVLRESEVTDTDSVVSRLAEVAATDELVVVIGSWPGADHALVPGLRQRLSRHDLVEMRIRDSHADLQECAVELDGLLEAGCLPVVITPTAVLLEAAAVLAGNARADRVLRVFEHAGEAALYPVWQRQREPSLI